MPQNAKSEPAPPAPPAPADEQSQEQSLQGWDVPLDDEQTALDALEKAFDYRGDVTISLRGGDAIQGFIFDRTKGDSLATSNIRLMGAKSDVPVSVQYSQIARVSFSGKDAAHGKSFETWIAKYVEKKLAGQAASIESEPLD